MAFNKILFKLLFLVVLCLMVAISCDAATTVPIRQKQVIGIRGHGAKLFSDNELFAFFSGGKGASLPPDSTKPGAFRILMTYAASGYPYARIDSMKSRETGRGIVLDLYVTEGNPLKLKSIAFIGNHYFSHEQMSSFLRMKKGDLFKQTKIQEGIRRIEDEYHAVGFPFSRAEVIDTLGLSVEELQSSGMPLTISVTEGGEGRIDTVMFEGITNTRTSVLKRYANLPLRSRATKAQLDAAERSLNHLPFLESVSAPQWILLPDKRTGVLFTVREGSPNSFSGILGYLPSNNQYHAGKSMVTGDVMVNMGNLFGTARSITGRWARRDQTSQDIDFRYHEPWLLGTPFHLDLFFNQAIQDSSYLNRGAGIGSSFMLTQTIILNAALEKNETIPDEYGQQTYKISRYNYLQGTLGFTYDTRDNPLNPRKGLYHSLALRISRRRGGLTASETAGSSAGTVFDRSIITDLELAYPVTFRQVTFFRFRASQMNSGGGEIPYSQWFAMGGARTLRGYRELQFRSPSLGWWNLEYRFLPERLSRFFVFYDGGFYKNTVGTPPRWNLKHGYGMGFRINTGIGIIGVDYGMGEGDGPTAGKIHVSLENRF